MRRNRTKSTARAGVLSGLILALMFGAMSTAGGCGPSKRRPAEADVSGVPAAVIEQFRRDFPNGIILGAREVRGDSGPEWRIEQYTPIAARKTTWYSAEGVKVRGW